jgi:hypothetical protein
LPLHIAETDFDLADPVRAVLDLDRMARAPAGTD